jgi:hypothetical protein
MKKSMKWAVGIGSLLAAATLALMVSAAIQGFGTLCEVCVTFEGRTQCREAYGQTRAEAVRTATDNACGMLTSGMTNSIRCGKTVPDTSTCE